MGDSYTYPLAAPTGNLTTAQIQLLLANPRVIAKRLQTLADLRYLADFLLTGRFNAVGGGIFYENGDEVLADANDPEAVAPGGEYPLSVVGRGTLSAARTTKWGRDSEVYDEAISRLGINPVNRAITKLVNANIRYIDTVAWGVIASKVTGTIAASGSWTAGTSAVNVGNIVQSAINAQAGEQDLEDGINRDTIVLSTTAYAKVVGNFVSAGVLPRESGNALINGRQLLDQPFNLLGFNWVRSSHVTGTDPWLFDRDQLGGMADEDLGSPGYFRPAGGAGIEALTERLTGRDGWRLRARRVTVPVVIEPLAGIRITGTGL